MVEFDVVDLGETDHVAEDEEAPDFVRPLVTEEYWEDVALSELLEGGPVLLVFTPMDGSFPSTYVWNEIRDRDWGERTAPPTDDTGLAVVGCSISTPYEHETLIDEREMEYALYSDPANGVAESYGIVHDLDGMAGVSEPRPATFLLDGDGTVRYAWVATEWPEFPDYDEIEAELDRV